MSQLPRVRGRISLGTRSGGGARTPAVKQTATRLSLASNCRYLDALETRGVVRRLIVWTLSERPHSRCALYLGFPSCEPFLDDLRPTRDFVLKLSSESSAVASY